MDTRTATETTLACATACRTVTFKFEVVSSTLTPSTVLLCLGMQDLFIYLEGCTIVVWYIVEIIGYIYCTVNFEPCYNCPNKVAEKRTGV